MRIVRLTAENIKRLSVVDITPGSSGVVTISGENGAGKSSLLDCIPWALAGTDGIQPVPIHAGETKARIRLDLGEVVVERKFTAKGTTVSVMSAEGAKFPSPQTMLDGFLGTFAFDPEEFSRMKPREQFDALAGLVKLGIDLDAIDKANREDFALRTVVNRDAKTARAQAEGIAVPEVAESAPVDEAALVTELQAANDANAEIQRATAAAQAAVKVHGDKLAALSVEAANVEIAISAARKRMAEAETEIKAGMARVAVLDAQARALKEERPPCPADTPLRDVAEIRRRIDAARETNTFLADRAKLAERRAEIEKRAAELEEKSAALTKAMETRTAERMAAIASASMPVPDIGFGDGIVLYKGVPFEQASDAEKIRVGMAVAMAANPKLRVIRIRAGSLLDAKSKAEVARMATERDYQVWVEQVAVPGAPMGFVIEDGRLAG